MAFSRGVEWCIGQDAGDLCSHARRGIRMMIARMTSKRGVEYCVSQGAGAWVRLQCPICEVWVEIGWENIYNSLLDDDLKNKICLCLNRTRYSSCSSMAVVFTDYSYHLWFVWENASYEGLIRIARNTTEVRSSHDSRTPDRWNAIQVQPRLQD